MRATNDGARRLRAALTIELHALVQALDRRAPTRTIARVATRSLVRATLRRLSRDPALRSVYARGSHGRGDFVPLASDLDLALVLREPERKPDFAATLGVVHALDRVRRWNPLVRDAWQMIVGDTEWPLVERYANLFQLDEWRDVDGRAPEFSRFAVDERLALAAAWNRQHLWTDSALRHVLAPAPLRADGTLVFAAAEKKCLSLASHLSGAPPPRRRRSPPVDADDAFMRASALLEHLEDSARLVASRTGVTAPGNLPHARPAVDEMERTVVAAIRRTRTGSASLQSAILHSGIVAVVTSDATLEPQERIALVRDLARIARETGRRFFVYSPLTLALAPIYEPMCVLRLDRDVAHEAETAPPDPLLLHEQLSYEALFAGTELRGSASRTVEHPGLDYLTQRLTRLLVYFESGQLVRVRAETLSRLRTLRPDVVRALDDATDRRRRFAADAAMFEALVEALERSALTSTA